MRHYSEFNLNEQSQTILKRKKANILNEILTFDTETTSLYKIDGKWKQFDKTRPKEYYREVSSNSFVYLWSFGYNDNVYYGRTIKEFKQFITKLHNQLKRKYGKNLDIVIYVHNLPFDLVFLRNEFKIEDSFQRKPYKVMKCRTKSGIQFKDSYVYSNLSLESISKTNEKYKKLSGDKFDYSKIRLPWTTLDPYELAYSEMDCLALYEYLAKEKKKYRNWLTAMPLTNTGKVRRALYNKIKKECPAYIWHCQKLVPYLQEFKDLLQLFMGGVTHLNALWNGIILNNLGHKDYTSSYPTVLLCEKYATEHFTPWKGKQSDIIGNNKFLWYGMIDIYDFKSNHGFPYIPSHKCVVAENCRYDNGKYYSGEHVRIMLTSVDYEIICENYDFRKLTISDMKIARCDYINDTVRDFILDLYETKSRFKNDDSNVDLYSNAKNMFNAVFGMQVCQTIQPKIEWNESKKEYEIEEDFGDKQIVELLEKQRNNRKLTTIYSHGVFCTAYARRNLYNAINCISDWKDCIYCDTDSIMFMNEEKYKDNFEKLNDEIDKKLYESLSKEQISKALPWNEKAKKVFQIGILEDDEHFKQFISYGAKKYAYINDNDELKITVAGLSKKACKYLNSLEDFKKGLVFDYDKSGRTDAVYNMNQEPIITSKGIIDSPMGLTLRPTTYTLGTTKDYELFYSEIQSEHLIWTDGIFTK